jgi:tetratricopeptide (TPR) repeat protein
MQTSKILFRIVTLILAAALITSCSKEARKARLLGEADSYFRAGNYDKAKVTYLNVIRLDPQNAFAFERIGAMWQDQSAPLRAIPFLKRASELDPKNAQNRIRLARCYLATARFADAAKEGIKVLEQLPDNGDAIMALAEAARSKEDIEAAKQQLEKFPNKNDLSFYLASANQLLRKGDLAAAVNSVQQALAIDSQSSAAHMAMGDLYVIQKDLKQASEEYKKAADLAPVRSTERLKYAAFKLATGGTEETRRVATDMTKQAPDYLPGWILLAQLAAKDKKYDEALSLLENVFSRDPEYGDGRRLQGDALLAKGDTKKAVEILERLDQTYPGAPLIKHQLARAYLKNNNTNQAKVALEQAITASPTYTDAVLLLAEINLRSGHADMVLKPMTDLLKRMPEIKKAALLLATAYGSLDRFDDAITVLEEQAKLAPDDPQIQAVLGRILRQAKRYDEARGAFEKAARFAPDDPRMFNQLVELDLLAKHFDAARQRVRQQFEKNPDPPAAHFWESKILAAEGKWNAAEAEARRTLELDPNFSSAYDLLVQTYLATNKLPQAVSELQGVLSKNPKSTSALMTLALIYERMKDYPKERDAYEKLLAINPDFVPALNNLAYLYTEQLPDLEKAYDLARKAHDLRPGDIAASDTLGWVLYKRGDFQQALPILQESAEQAPDSAEIQFHLGMTAYMMRQVDLAKVALRKAASAAEDFPGKEESKQRLASLESGKGASPELSVSQLEAMIKAQPNDIISQMRLGEAYEKQGASEKAAAAYEQAFKINPKLPTPVIRLAELYAGPLENKEKAFAYAKKARELAPGDTEVAGILGKVANESGNFSWAYSLLQEAARQGRNDPSLLRDLAWAAYNIGKVNDARGAMQKIVTATPNSAEADDAKKFLSFIALDENPKELAASENEIQKELTSNPQYVPARMAQAALQAQRGEVKQATGTYADILRRYPDLAPAQKHLAALYAQEPSTVSLAYDLAGKARKALPDDPELAELLGRLSYEKKEYPRAIQLFQESARKRPLDADSLFYMGMSQLQTRQRAEAQGILNQALVAGLRDPQAAEAKRALADLQRE